MKKTLRKLVPAIAVGVVLACSYVAPAFGVTPVTSTVPVPCGRYGGGYSGDKHLVACSNIGGNGAPEGQPGGAGASNAGNDLLAGGLAAGDISGRASSAGDNATGSAAVASTSFGQAASSRGALAQPAVVLNAQRLAQAGHPSSGSDSLPLALGLALVAIVCSGGVLVLSRRRED
jgi:hypothetical protein